jgi:hypothetical protein
MTWHIDPDTAQRYVFGAISRPTAVSVERHLTSCAECRSLLTVDEAWLERSWSGIAEHVEPGTNLMERALRRLGVPEVPAKLVALSPAMRVSFLVALLLVIGFAVLAAGSNPSGRTYQFFLAIAPLVPVLGVAFAYGRVVDPAHEMTLVSPIDSFFVLLIRAATVVAVALLGGLVSWPLVPAPASVGVSAWLLPAFALTLATLALASRFEMWLAAAMVAGGWVIAVTLAVTRELEAFGSTAQIVHLILALGAGALVVLRRNQYDRQGGGR